ncbi:hypothetical protein H310_04928 [Aphanomyces invadans]|uniref:Serine aminopeptidase S33 domain-containing protein n=1 Tax=Aphanomyces invadans TaxID=157072 RepID=A0A024UC80_9STRA|nr:hypothetical protein H310_04928 [Aphanomyces invadans]ETW03477.1 hypothetical protein H310_04928 [Aphanomyces invadans]|eukprot:XP_008867706.1 hypothetical protein H310_04928 [Aphanomyces invadans]
MCGGSRNGETAGRQEDEMGAGASFEVFAPGELEGEMHAMDAATSSSSSWEMFKAGYDTIVHTIIRPPRHEYSESVALGPSRFDADDGTKVSRFDLTILTAQNEALRCSVWDCDTGRNSCVLYLHGISGSRVEGLALLGPVLRMGHAFAAMDCRGSGLSDGKYISMGLTEHEDAWVMLKALHKFRCGQFQSVHIWGRCMGANAALMLLQGGSIQTISASVPLKSVDLGVQELCGDDLMVVTSSQTSAYADVAVGDMLVAVDGRDVRGKTSGHVLSLLAEASPDTRVTLCGLRRGRPIPPSTSRGTGPTSFIPWMVLDTAFIDLSTVLHDMVTTAQSSDIGWQIPSFVVSAGIALLRSTIKRTAGFDLHAVAPRECISKAIVPSVFVHGMQDSFVPLRHSESILKAYNGDSKTTLVSFPGTHDSLRSRDLIESVLTKAHILSHTTSSGPPTDDELAIRRQLFPSTAVYPTWSTPSQSTWKDQDASLMETPRADDASIAPYTAYATSYREASASTGGGTHVEYTISVFAPGHRFVQLSPSALNVFGAKEKLSEGRTTQDTTSPDDHEIKSLWKTFTSQAKRATGASSSSPHRRKSWFGPSWRQKGGVTAERKHEPTEWSDLGNAKEGSVDDDAKDNDESDASQHQEECTTGENVSGVGGGDDAGVRGATFQVDRRYHDIKLLLTKLSALPGGLPNELQTIRSKLVYSTKIGSARLDERIQLLNATLQVICSSAVLWNHPIVHQFLCLDDASTT